MIEYNCTKEEALERARHMIGWGQYLLGTGDYWPHTEEGRKVDLPWTQSPNGWGSDCAGFAISYCWKIVRHRKGFNSGPWATVSDDVNSDSALEDALHKHELFKWVNTPRPGDLLIYPSIRLSGKRFIGHVGLIEAVPAEWDPASPPYNLLTVIQCHGPNGFKPGVVRTDGSVWQHHDTLWPKLQHRTQIVRPKERI